MGKEGNGRDDVFGFEKCRPLRRSMTDELLVENSEKLKPMEEKNLNKFEICEACSLYCATQIANTISRR